jgi:hypothetical protein
LFSLIAIAGGIVMVTAYKGRAYYTLPIEDRYRSDLHAAYKPGGSIGHPLGIGGSILLVALLSYSLRKRFRLMRGFGPLSRWLQFHIFCGTAGPALILFHTSFKMRGIVAISFWCMAVVFISGIIGRYLYAQIPHALSGQEIQYEDLNQSISELNAQLAGLMKEEDFLQIRSITDSSATVKQVPAFRAFFLMIVDDLGWILRKNSMNRLLKTYEQLDSETRKHLSQLLQRRRLQMRRISMLKTSHELFRHWHVIHLPLAQTMYLTMTIHIVIAVMTGYF